MVEVVILLVLFVIGIELLLMSIYGLPSNKRVTIDDAKIDRELLIFRYGFAGKVNIRLSCCKFYIYLYNGERFLVPRWSKMHKEITEKYEYLQQGL
jgi:hypothetical protein